MRLQQRLLVLIGKSNRNRLISRQHPMPTRHPPRRLPAELDRHNHLAQQRQQPAHWPHKSLRPARPPGHILRPVDPRQLLRQFLGNHLRRRASRLHRSRRQVLALRRRHRLQSRHIDARLAREGHRRRRRRAILICNLHRWPNQLLGHILLPSRHAGNPDRQPPRRGEALAPNTSRNQPLALQHRHHALLQLRLRAGNHPRRNLFQPDLKQKLRHYPTHPSLTR